MLKRLAVIASLLCSPASAEEICLPLEQIIEDHGGNALILTEWESDKARFLASLFSPFRTMPEGRGLLIHSPTALVLAFEREGAACSPMIATDADLIKRTLAFILGGMI